jgi:DNA-binding beta-propeller fold protein YncE
MRLYSWKIAVVLLAALTATLTAQQAGPYKVLTTATVGGDGGFDYVYADPASRKLYIPRMGVNGRITVFDLDTLNSAGNIPGVNAHGVAVDGKSSHGFGSSKPVIMFDSATLTTIKTIDVQGGPDGILGDPTTGHIYILSHSSPNVTVVNAADGAVVGTIDVGGAPEQSVLDGKGHLYIDLEDKGSIAVVDTGTLKLTGTFSLAGKGDGCAGLAIDAKNGILFAACRNPQTMVILRAADGVVLTTLPIGNGSDGAVFNPATMEAFSSQGDGTLTVIKENSPTSFSVEQNVTTMPRAKTLTLDSKTGHILLIAAQYAPPPANAPAVNGRPARGQIVPGSFSILVVGK